MMDEQDHNDSWWHDAELQERMRIEETEFKQAMKRRQLEHISWELRTLKLMNEDN